MDFEWDEEKRSTNVEKHQVDLLDAMLIFEGLVVTWRDERRDYGEDRFISIGMVDGEFLVVSYTYRGLAIRLISARKGGRRDRRRYQARVAGGDPAHEGSG